MQTAVDAPKVLGFAHIEGEHLGRIVAKALHCDAVAVTSVDVEMIDYPIGSIATGALMRCNGSALDDSGNIRSWSVFVKQLQSARVWPLLHVIPEQLRDEWISGFPWRIEIDAQLSTLACVLPDGIRLPELYEVVEIDEDRAAMWMEDVDVAIDAWTTDRFARAAYLLGVVAGRRPFGSGTAFGDPVHSSTPGLSLAMYVHGRVRNGFRPLLDSDELWSHPALVGESSRANETSLRADLLTAYGRLDELLDLMNALPQTLVHGDASPQNLLVPRSAPDTFVAIDWGFHSPHCVGFDLGQLLVGLVNVGELSSTELPAVLAAILPAYVDGLVSTGFDATPGQVRLGMIASVVVRSLFGALPLEELGAPDSPALRARLRNRIGLTRFLLDLSAELG